MAVHRWCADFASCLPTILIPGERLDSYIIHEKRLKIGTNAATSATRIVLKDGISFTSNLKTQTHFRFYGVWGENLAGY